MKILGLMSGTSCDGLDIALAEISSLEKIQLLKTNYVTYPEGLRSAILGLIHQQESGFRHLKEIEDQLSYFYLDAINAFLKQEKIDLIAVHGQTIFHQAKSAGDNGRTWQIFNAEIISKNLNCDVIYDFRTADIVVGGHGAPLAPFLDYYYFNDPLRNQCVINIGGISNGSFLKKRENEEQLIAYDFGPGNCLIDMAVNDLYKKQFDYCGELSAKGKVDFDLVKKWMDEDIFIKKKGPKSTGREYYSLNYYYRLKNDVLEKKISDYDFIASLTQFTFNCIDEHIKREMKNPDELIISGGGAKNTTLMNIFRKSGYKIRDIESDLIDFKEALLIAVLGFAHIKKIPSNLPSVTGAKKKVILGKRSPV